MLLRKLLRTAWKYKAQFISMIIMVAIGIGVFVGFNMEWKSIEVDTGKFFEDTLYADYRLYNTTGFSKKQAAAIQAIDGVDAATRYLTVNVGIAGTTKQLALNVMEEPTVSIPYLIEGEPYDSEGSGMCPAVGGAHDKLVESEVFAERPDAARLGLLCVRARRGVRGGRQGWRKRVLGCGFDL